MEENRILVPPAVSEKFTEIAHTSRTMWHMVTSCGTPQEDSRFARVEDLYQFEKVSNRARHYVLAGLEHLVMWADFAAPFKFHPQQTTTFTLRPTLTLARAALESAAQAVWLMDAPNPTECVRRHLCLIRWDLEEHRKSYVDPESEEKRQIRKQDEELVARVSAEFNEEQIRPPKSYLWILQQACQADDLTLEARQVEKLWRAASGAAHGMHWTNLELTDVVAADEKREDGEFRAITVPDPKFMLEVLRASETMTTFAAVKYVLLLGEDPSPRIEEAGKWVANQITFKPGTDPAIVRRLKGEEPDMDK